MTFSEKNAWAFLGIAVAAYATYVAVVIARAGGGPLSGVDYAPVMLLSIGGAIVAGILATIVISITAPRSAGTRDARDRDIERLGAHVGQAFLAIGGLAALLLALVEAPWFWIANALYLGFVLSAVVGSIARVVAYRRGLA